MSYIDGYVIPVPTDKKEKYREVARRGAQVFAECGALRIVETWGDEVPDGQVTDFKKAVKAEAGEAIVFSWVEWPSKDARDAGMKKALEDPRMSMSDCPFDPKRMILGGFAVLVDSKA